MDRRSWIVIVVPAALACGGDSDKQPPFAGDETHATNTLTGGAESGGSGDTSGADGAILDVEKGETGGQEMSCELAPDGSGTLPCVDEAPPDSFEPDVQWTWSGDPWSQVVATPIVANLSDDDGDDRITVCDIPDVVVIGYDAPTGSGNEGYLFVLNGDDGTLRFRIDHPVYFDTEPAVGDIDGDGWPEIVAAEADGTRPTGRLVAFEHDGTLKWTSDQPFPAAGSPVGIADLDQDGTVEVYANAVVVKGEDGTTVRNYGDINLLASVAIDLDQDGSMELLLGTRAYSADGSLYYDHGAFNTAFPHVADFDADGDPEVLLVTPDSLVMLEHDGTLAYQMMFGTGYVLWRPASVHDIDADGAPEIAVPSEATYGVYEADFSLVWDAPSTDTGFASSTAFDFLGDGSAEAMYADHTHLYIYDGTNGDVLLTSMRESWTQIESPVVADVDNDGSAEIVVVSNKGNMGGTYPAVQVIRDREDRWVPARRIWNQFTYHVSNVREDGTIPTVEPAHWLSTNTYRTQAQISLDGDGPCIPPVD